MVVLAAIMAGATVYESLYSAKEARAFFYHTIWFNGLLGLLAMNILFATANRWPFKPRHTGFVLTHLAILVILGGAVVTLWFGTEGTLRIREGAESSSFAVDQIAVGVTQTKGSRLIGEAEVGLDVDETHPARGLGESYPVQGAGLTLKPLAYYPHSEWEERYVADPDGHPAAEVILASGAQREALWLHTAPSAHDVLALGKMRIRLTAVADEATLARHLESKLSSRSEGSLDQGRVLVSADGNPPVELVVQESLGRTVEIPGSQATVTLVRYVPHAAVGAGGTGLISRSDRPVNPAVVLDIAGQKGTDQRMLFARYPEMSTMHRQGKHWPGIRAEFKAPFEKPKQRTLALLAGPKDQFNYALTEEDGSVRSGQVTLGQSILPDALGFTLSVGQFHPSARLETQPRPLPITKKDQGTRPALNVLLEGEGEPASTWLVWGRPVDVTLGDESYRLVLGSKQEALPFKVRLEQFEEERYPGLRRASMWRSHVTVVDSARGLSLHRVIQMNEPLKYAGYTFFQSSFDRSGPRAISVLTVSRDPGKWIVYGGFVLLIVGVSTMVATKRVLRRQSTVG